MNIPCIAIVVTVPIGMMRTQEEEVDYRKQLDEFREENDLPPILLVREGVTVQAICGNSDVESAQQAREFLAEFDRKYGT